MFKFDNKISIDGVAVIIAAIGAVIWLGRLETRVCSLEATQIVQDQHIEAMAQREQETAQNLAYVTATVNAMKSYKQ
jgi:hypothetical protein